MKRAILTGFEPFGPYKFNPTQDIAKEYDGTNLRGIEIIGLVLPCAYYGAFEKLSKQIDEFSPDLILSAGLSSSIPRFRLEAVGKNIMNGKYPDADDKKPENAQIIIGGKPEYRTNCDTARLAKEFESEGFSVDISYDAEGFICNSLLYLTSGRIHDRGLQIKNAFLHTPWTDDYLDRINLEQNKVTVKKEDLKEGIETLLIGMANSC
ncbi:MAG: pyroglutamyl-peptidase I [Nanoarchaeota archaeon]|nr:pyroglutamyl-peptidase I [Nanoarchaeota archaeon]